MKGAKLCTKCDTVKPEAEFHKAGQRGFHSWCKKCFNESARAHRNKKVTPEQRRRNNLWTRYRMRPEDAEAMAEAQGGLCGICGEKPQRPVIDHNHETGAVRGLLCHGCNIKLPAVEDKGFLEAALRYLGEKE